MSNNTNEEKLKIKRHSLSHVLATAVLDMFPEAKLGIGPAVDNGFYYDFELPRTLIPEDLEILEGKMKEIIKANHPFERKEISIAEAIDHFRAAGQDYKVELIKALEKEGEKEVSVYKSGPLVDLCSGPHIDSTGEIDPTSFKLHKIAGAYWKGDEKRPMLQRIYGLAFSNKKALKEYLQMIEEAEKRDHRKIGKELELFLIDPLVGMGLILWQPKGAMIERVMEDYWYDIHLKNGYQLVKTPHIGNRKLWEMSGHWGFYNESMYPTLEVGQTLKDAQEGKKAEVKEEYILKPMNCPFHIAIYNSKPHSYRDLPMRLAECGTVYRYEKSGELSGLTRVRGFTQDDAHLICRQDQVRDELKAVNKLILKVLGDYGFKEFKVYLSLRDPNNKEKYAGSDEGWEFAQKVLEEIAVEQKLDYIKEEGEAAFYGPKLDYKIKDCMGREWQCSTLQFDFNLPERFDMTFVNERGEKERPYMLHRVLYGAFERFFGVLIEHYAGAFPVWLSPVQARVIPVSEKFSEYAGKVLDNLKAEGIRVEMDDSDESLGKRIREAEKQKIPYMLVVGEKESSDGTVAVRKRGEKQQQVLKIEEFLDQIRKEIENKN